MSNQSSDGSQQRFSMKGKRVTVLGYGPEARDHAMGLRAAGVAVTVGVRMGGMSWVRAQKDGFTPKQAALAVRGADVAVLLVPAADQASIYWHAVAPNLAPGALVVVGSSLALHTGSLEPRGVDVVLVTDPAATASTMSHVAVHADATGGALERAIAYCHAAFGERTAVGTTTIEAEAAAELDSLEARAGGPELLAADVARAAAHTRDSHAPDEARLVFYARLEEAVARRAAPSRARPIAGAPSSTVLAAGAPSRTRGAA
jgi:ketol-acid reductoisomerase